MSSLFRRTPAAGGAKAGSAGRQGAAGVGEDRRPGRPNEPVGREVADGCAWLAAWLAALVFAPGAVVLLLVVVTGEGGAYGLTAISALLTCLGGVVMLGAATIVWAFNRVRHRSTSRRRTAALLAALGGALVLGSFLVADLVGWVKPLESWLPVVAGITLLGLAAVLAAERSERRPALIFAAAWILLLGGLAYRTWTDLRVDVIWLGPNVVDGSPGQLAFSATRSGDFEVRFGAHTCWDGRIIATGHYMWQPGDRYSSYGAPMWVELPSDVLPLHDGDLVRVCVRDWLAAGTRAGEAADPPSFWPRD